MLFLNVMKGVLQVGQLQLNILGELVGLIGEFLFLLLLWNFDHMNAYSECIFLA